MRKNLRPILFGAMVLFLAIYSLQNIFVTFRQSFRNIRYITTHPSDSYDDKMRIYWWTVYDYLQFVKQNTPENARILIPPQERPWLTSGNTGIVQYFLYPRKLLSGSLDKLPSEPYDYVMLVHGEWPDAPPEKYGWPKVTVPNSETIYFNPDNSEDKNVNGLIKIKEEK